MSTVPPHLIRPVSEVTREKHSTLDFERLPQGEFHMNFRPRFIVTLLHGWGAIGLFIKTSAVGLVATGPISYWIAPMVATMDWFVGTLLIGALAVLAHATGLTAIDATAEQRFNLTSLAWIFLAPVGIWAALAMATLLTTPEGALLYLTVLTLPTIVFTADQIATHSVYWMTAHPQVPAEVMQACRQAWAERFGVLSPRPNAPAVSAGRDHEGEAVVESYQDYLFSFFWLTGSMVLPAFVVIACSSRTSRAQTGFEFVLAIVFALSLVSLLRIVRQPASFPQYWQFLIHFLSFQHAAERMPGWVFESPSGSLARRRRTVAVALFLVGLTVIPTADFFSYLATCPASAPLIPDYVSAAFAEDHVLRFPLALKAVCTGEYYLGLCLLLAGVACIAMPALILVLAAFVVIGPVVTAHHHALEE
jgi:hypothetical protein